MELRDRIAVVTGGANGIGLAIAEAFLAEGAERVVVADLDPVRIDEVVDRLGERAVGFVADVSEADEIEALVERVEAEIGPIDVFVSNAGIGTGMGLDADEEAWERIWHVNVLAHVHAARAVVPSMISRGGGYLVSTASAAGLLAQIGDLPYSVTKHAAVAVAEWLALTYRDDGIRVSCLCPQGVRTDMIAGTGAAAVDTVLSQGVIEPEDAAGALVDAMRKERFLVLPHTEVATYYERRATDTDRWLAGMARLQSRITAGVPAASAARVERGGDGEREGGVTGGGPGGT